MRKRFVVTVNLPEGVSAREMCDYIREAVAVWHGSKWHEDPIYRLDGKRVTVTPLTQSRFGPASR